ncbi:hypothetical protein [Nocardia sp. NPDC052566]|uniref:hypothetical protein n=1 Tax=Nocardia sp. NPDC052566 TaxID=3364330 RepID=UPI0037C84B5A
MHTPATTAAPDTPPRRVSTGAGVDRAAGTFLILAALLAIAGSLAPISARGGFGATANYTAWRLAEGGGSTVYLGIPLVAAGVLGLMVAVLPLVGLGVRYPALRVCALLAAFLVFMATAAVAMAAALLNPEGRLWIGLFAIVAAAVVAFVSAVLSAVAAARAPRPVVPSAGEPGVIRVPGGSIVILPPDAAAGQSGSFGVGVSWPHEPQQPLAQPDSRAPVSVEPTPVEPAEPAEPGDLDFGPFGAPVRPDSP